MIRLIVVMTVCATLMTGLSACGGSSTPASSTPAPIPTVTGLPAEPDSAPDTEPQVAPDATAVPEGYPPPAPTADVGYPPPWQFTPTAVTYPSPE